MFNAVVGSNTDPDRMVRDFDTISVCLSKGLGAPVGSVLVGDTHIIQEAHRSRKRLGGGMRQSGMLAAAGLYALDNNIERLSEDHSRARILAEAIEKMPNFSVDLDAVQSNMVYVNCLESDSNQIMGRLSQRGVDVLDESESIVRAVVHLHITDEDIERAIGAFDESQ